MATTSMTPEFFKRCEDECAEFFELRGSFTMNELDHVYYLLLKKYQDENKELCIKYFGLESPFNPAELKEAYKAALLKYHPDKGGDQYELGKVTELYKNITTDDLTNLPADFSRKKQLYLFTKEMMIKLGLKSNEYFPVYDLFAVIRRLYGTIPFYGIIALLLFVNNINPILFGVGMIYFVSKVGFLNSLGGLVFTRLSFVGICRLVL